MIPKVFDDNAMSAAQVKVWHESFKDGQVSIKVIHILEVLQQAEHLRMLNMYRLQSTKVGDSQCEN